MYITTVINISEDDYNKLLRLTKEEAFCFMANVAEHSPFHPCGYGFNSPKFYEENGKYYVSWQRWSSCD
jgi:hypothetical protein